MTPLHARFCFGCGHFFDEMLYSDDGPTWITADAYHKKYGVGLNSLHLTGDACPPCASVFDIHDRLERFIIDQV